MAEVGDEAEDRFRCLFAGHSRVLLGYALRRVSEPADAADVVAETFLVAWRRLDDLPAGGDARLWLFGCARRVLANQRRGELRRSKLAVRLSQELCSLDLHDEGGIDASSLVVRAAMARLEADDRELLWLTAWEGLTPTQIAVVFERAPGTVRSQLHRARGRLRAHLDDLGHRSERSAGERSGGAGHVGGGERTLVQDLRGER